MFLLDVMGKRENEIQALGSYRRGCFYVKSFERASQKIPSNIQWKRGCQTFDPF